MFFLNCLYIQSKTYIFSILLNVIINIYNNQLIINTYPRNAKNIPNKLIRSNIYSAFKPISDEIHNNVGFELNLSNILGLSLINVFFAGNIPFSPKNPRTIHTK